MQIQFQASIIRSIITKHFFEVEQLNFEVEQLNAEVEQLNAEVEQLNAEFIKTGNSFRYLAHVMIAFVKCFI